MPTRYKLTLTRDGKTAYAVFRADDYATSMVTRKGVTSVRWGSGKLWTVMAVEVVS